MKKHHLGKLRLDRQTLQTLRSVQQSQLAQVAGGITTLYTYDYYPSCVPLTAAGCA